MMHRMGVERDDLAAVIGARIRAGRHALKWTLDEVAAQSGVSRRMIVTVEKGEANPSVATLLLLSDALGIGLPTLVAARDGVPAALTRRGDGAELWSSPSGGSGILLAGTPSPDVLELWQWTLAPGDTHESTPHVAGTREILHVGRGVVNLTAGPDEVSLSPGDTFAFDGDHAHAYANTSNSTAEFTLAVFEPGVGTSSPRPSHQTT